MSHTDIYGAIVNMYFRNELWVRLLEQVRLLERIRYVFQSIF